MGKQAVQQEGEFAAHLIAWDRKNGQIRDSKVALPVIGLAFEHDVELLDNAYDEIYPYSLCYVGYTPKPEQRFKFHRQGRYPSAAD